MKIYPSVQKIIDTAHSMGLDAIPTGKHPGGGHRRYSALGSTHAPHKTVIIEGITFSNSSAGLFLMGKRARALSAQRMFS